MLTVFLLFLLGLFFLIKGSGYLIDSSTHIARHFGISELVIGLTLVSLGTSLPEFAVSTVAALSKNSVISIANVIGSNIYNLFVLTALIGFVTRYHFKTVEILQRDIVWLLLTSIWIVLIAISGFINAEMGILFISLYLVYIIYLYKNGKEGRRKKESHPPLKIYFMFLLSFVLIYLGAKLTIDSAVLIARFFGLSEWVISASLLGAGTGFPETFTSLMALKRKKLKMGLGNIIGSNIFNILVVIGFSSIILPIQINFAQHFYSFFFLLLSSIFIALIAIKGSFHRKTALISIGLYLIYLYSLFS